MFETMKNLLLVWFLCLGQLIYAQNNSELELVVLENANPRATLQYEKWEMGIKLPQELQVKIGNYMKNISVPSYQKLNPYLEWEIRIVTTFTHESGETRQADGFYFVNIDRDTDNDTWINQGTAYSFRIRFAPPLTGEWTYKTQIFVQNKLYEESASSKFNVISSSNPGFVTRHKNGQNLALGNADSLFLPVGACLAFPNGSDDWILNYGVNTPFMQHFKLHYWGNYLKNVESFARKGGKYMRFIVNPVYSDIEFEKLGDYTDRMPFAYEMDQLLDLCKKYGIYVHFNLRHHTPIYRQSNYEFFHWDFEPGSPKMKANWKDSETYAYYKLAKNGKPSDLVFDSIAMNYQKQRYRYLIARYGYSTNISCFEILSEPQHMDGYFKKYSDNLNGGDDIMYEPAMDSDSTDGMIARKAIYTYHQNISSYIKNHLQHKDHLLSAVGTMGKYFTMSAQGRGFTYNDSTLFIPEIDIVSISTYSNVPSRFLISKGNKLGSKGMFEVDPDENSVYNTFSYLRNTTNKIPFIAETGVADGFNSCSFDSLYRWIPTKFMFSGIAGLNMWEGFDYSTEEKKVLNAKVYYPTIADLYRFMNSAFSKEFFSESWNQGRWTFEGIKNDNLREIQFYVSSSQQRVFGYVANNTYNIKTLAKDSTSGCFNMKVPEEMQEFKVLSDCSKRWLNCKKVMIQGLKSKTQYKVTWYNYQLSQTHTEVILTDKKGFWKMSHPDLDWESPMYIYYLEEVK